jgi:hypothetical protein
MFTKIAPQFRIVLPYTNGHPMKQNCSTAWKIYFKHWSRLFNLTEYFEKILQKHYNDNAGSELVKPPFVYFHPKTQVFISGKLFILHV